MRCQQLNSSTAQQLSCSVAQLLSCSVAGLDNRCVMLILGLMPIVLSGCPSPTLGPVSLARASSNDGSPTSAVATQIDAGIIFADEASYLCFPLERFGVRSSSEIASIDTSCECVRARLVRFQLTETTAGDALRLDFVPEERQRQATEVAGTDRALSAPAHLGIVISLRSTDGSTRELKLTVLHAHATGGGSL